MSRSVLTPMVALWSSAQLGCAAFLLIGLLPRSPLSLELLTQLSWLALIGSVPTTLALGSAAGAARATRSVAMAVALAIGGLGMAVAWTHTDFLLSGPAWMLHPQRRLVQVVARCSGLALARSGSARRRTGLAGHLGLRDIGRDRRAHDRHRPLPSL